MSEESVEEVTKCLEEVVQEKSEALNTLNIAVNEYVRLKNQYIIQSNMLRIKPDQIKEDLGLSKPATEKQQQAYIDDQLKDLVQDMRIADANVSSWKREIDLLDDKIQVEKYKFKILIEKGVI